MKAATLTLTKLATNIEAQIAGIKKSPLPIRHIDEWGPAEPKLRIQAGLDVGSARNACHSVSPHDSQANRAFMNGI